MTVKSNLKVQTIKEEKAVIKTEEIIAETINACPKCGLAYSSKDKFCSECGFCFDDTKCGKCGAEILLENELCPICGDNLTKEICSFCGNATSIDENFCSECGNPKKGIQCPSCNTLNFRSFCRKCNTPLNEQANQAIALAKKDPLVKKTASLIEELTQLEKIILAQTEETEQKQLSEEDLELINKHRELLASISGMAFEKEKTKPKPKSQPQSLGNKITISVGNLSKEEEIEKYKEKLQEIQEALSAMIPDAGMTPQMQRDFYSARKVEVEVITKHKVSIGWRCKAYGCLHSQPNECTKPFSGGTWIYEEREVLTKEWMHK